MIEYLAALRSKQGCCCLSGRTESRAAGFDALDLVEDADWLQGRFVASYYALGARRSWYIIIRNGTKVPILKAWK